LKRIGMKAGRSSTAVFGNQKSEANAVVHGDDFTFLGHPEELDEVEKSMRSWYDIKVRGRIVDSRGDDKTILILDRMLTWTGQAFLHIADPHTQK
jgi:hypothetical protein